MHETPKNKVSTGKEPQSLNGGDSKDPILSNQLISGPLLFLLFINDIVTDIKASIKLFADDTSLYVTVDTPQSTADIINRDLKKIHQWSVNWLVKFNPQKTETMVISRKLIKPLHPPTGNEQSSSSTKYKS